MRRKRQPQLPDELFDKRVPVEAESPNVDDEENFKALGVADSGDVDVHGNSHIIGGREWRNNAKRRAGRPKHTR